MNELKNIKIKGISAGTVIEDKVVNDERGPSLISSDPIKKPKIVWRLLSIIVFFSLMVVGGIVGAALWSSFILPYASTIPALSKYPLFQLDKPVIIEKREQINVVDENSAVIEAVNKVSPAVVSIVVSKDVETFFGQTFRQQGGGTGFIVTSDGLIVTNKHMVDQERADYLVITADGQRHSAAVLARDPANDLAVIKIKAVNLPVVELGRSADLRIGQKVIAIGNSLGEYNNTVTTGVISALDRAIEAGNGFTSERLEGLLQTDAAINPGNSGGPLVNLKGQVIGINTAIDREGVAIGFAIPIDIIRPAIDSAISQGKIIRPMIGVRYIALNPEIAALNGLAITRGALIYSGQAGALAILPNSPAAKADLKEGDIIIRIDNIDIDETHSLATIIQRYKPGDKIEVTIIRNDETLIKLITLVEMLL